MNDIQAILNQIQADAQQSREALLAAAREKAEDTRSQGRQLAAQEEERLLADARGQVKTILQRADSQAGIEERSTLLAARRQMVDQAFTLAMEQLRAMAPADKVKLYTTLATQNLEGSAQLILNAADAAQVGPQVVEAVGKEKLTLCQTPGSFGGGLILRQGNIETNCTFEVLVGSIKEQLEPEVAALLFQ